MLPRARLDGWTAGRLREDPSWHGVRELRVQKRTMLDDFTSMLMSEPNPRHRVHLCLAAMHALLVLAGSGRRAFRAGQSPSSTLHRTGRSRNIRARGQLFSEQAKVRYGSATWRA